MTICPMANDLEVLFQYETDNIDQVELCIKAYMKKAQYRKYKKIYRVDLDIIKKTIKNCDAEINEINKEIESKNKKEDNYLIRLIKMKYYIY
jgi:hypothetical protein